MKPLTAVVLLGLGLASAPRAVAQRDAAVFLVSPAAQGVVLRWTWPETERPMGYHVDRREAGGAWTRLTVQPITRSRVRAEARNRLGRAFEQYESLLFPANPLSELTDPETSRSLLLLLADVDAAVASVLGLRYDDRQARQGVRYEYRLIAITRRGESQIGTGGPVVAGSFRPAAPPDSLQALQETHGVALRWATAGGFSAYQVHRRRGAAGPWEQLSSSPVIVFYDETGAGTEASAEFYRDSTARAGDTLAYAVSGIDPFGRATGRSAEFHIVVRDLVPPLPPSQVTSKLAGDTIVISWLPSPDPSVRTYRVWRSTSRTGTFDPVGSPLPATATTIRETGRPAGRLWWYYVTASDAAGNESSPSFMALAELPDLVPPSPPDSLRGTGGVGRLSLEWAAVRAPDLRGYRVYRALSPSAVFGLLNQSTIAAPRFTDSVPNGADHSFYYRVTSVDSAFNESGPSAVVAVRPPDIIPPSPPQITSVSPGEGVLVVTWAANPEPDVTWYRLKYRARTSAEWTERPDSVAASVKADTLTQLPAGSLIEVSLVAIDDAGNRSQPARPMTGRPFKRQPPPALEIRRASFNESKGAVTVEWSSPAAEVVRVAVLRRHARDSSWTEVAAVPATDRHADDRAPGRGPARVEYSIKAFDRFGNVSESKARGVDLPGAGR